MIAPWYSIDLRAREYTEYSPDGADTMKHWISGTDGADMLSGPVAMEYWSKKSIKNQVKPGFCAFIVLQCQLFKFSFGNKGINQFFNNGAVVIVHLFHGFELLQQLPYGASLWLVPA